MAEKITASLTVSDETITAELNTAARGATGISSISASTTTAFGGILAGDGSNVQLATTAQKIALPISTATQTALDAKETSGAAATVQGNLDTHEADTANPHTVTKAQVGLGSAANTSDASKPVSTAPARRRSPPSRTREQQQQRRPVTSPPSLMLPTRRTPTRSQRLKWG